MPYKWNETAGLGLVLDTFESAITWDRWPEFDLSVRAAVQDALVRVCGGGELSCRFTHVYPDGPAPYYTFYAPGENVVRNWKCGLKSRMPPPTPSSPPEVRFTHHHAVGRDHRPWYDRQRPDLFADALRAAKNSLDPAWVMNPGVLIDP